MRCYQHRGLTERAEMFLMQHVIMVSDKVCPKCGNVISQKKKVISTEHIDMFYGDGPDLHTYELKSGDTVKEVVQSSPWSSGPVCFLCLIIEGKRMFEWSQKEIDNA